MEDVRADDLEELADSLEEAVPPAPEMPSRSITEPQRSPEGAEKIQRLKSQEELLLRADRLLISDGARLVLFLPLMAIVLYGLAQTFTASNPQWWTDHIEATVEGLEMSTGIYGMALLMLVADTALLLILLRLMVLTRTIFRLEAKELTTIGLTFNSAHGYAEMRATIDGAIRQLGITILLMAMAVALLAASLWLPDDVVATPILVAFSTGALLSGHGVHMVSDRPRFNTSEPWGMLEAFSPPIHPALLSRPFTDVIRAHIDPLLAVRISQYLGSLDSKIHQNSSRRELQETLLHLLYLRRSSLIDEEQFRAALEPMVDASTLEGLFSHPELGEETWDRLLSRARAECPPFFRLHDRIRMRRIGGRTDDGIWLDVDMENLIVGQANLFAFVLNEGENPMDVVLKVQTPDFRPHECVYRLKIDPFSVDSESLSADISSSLLSTISATSIVWQSLLPSSMGEATVTVRLEDDAGNMISGRVLTVQVRSDLLTRIKMTLGGLFMVGAAIVVLSPMLPFLLNLLGL
jgi:hypothetical protein